MPAAAVAVAAVVASAGQQTSSSRPAADQHPLANFGVTVRQRRFTSLGSPLLARIAGPSNAARFHETLRPKQPTKQRGPSRFDPGGGTTSKTAAQIEGTSAHPLMTSVPIAP